MPITVRRPDGFTRRKPMGDMNVTPFIDVLLVLIIMLIMVVPIATHNTEVDLPGPGLKGSANPISNTVYIDSSDRLFWNGEAVTRDQLRANIAAANSMEDEPVLRFEPAALASYDRSAKTIALIKDAGAKKFAFIGNEKYSAFDSRVSVRE